MRKTIISASVFLSVLFSGQGLVHPSAAYGSDVLNRTISVTGEAEVRVVPDQAVITMSVQAKDTDLQSGQRRVDAGVSAALEWIKKQGVRPEHVQTDFVEVMPVFYSCNNSDRAAGTCDPTKTDYYDLKKGIVVCLKDLTRFEALISGSLKSGVTQIDNVQFVTTALRKHRDQARDMAVRAAREKAEAVAGALGQKLGKPITISLNSNSYYAGYYGRRDRGSYSQMTQNVVSNVGGGESPGGSETSTSLGQIKVDAQVNVTFQME